MGKVGHEREAVETKVPLLGSIAGLAADVLFIPDAFQWSAFTEMLVTVDARPISWMFHQPLLYGVLEDIFYSLQY